MTVGNYMKSHGMFDWVGTAYTVAPIAAIISPFFLGIIADRYFPSEKVLGVLHLLGAASMAAAPLLVPQGAEFFIGALLLHTLFYMPTLGLTNTLAFHNITNQEREFPIIRVFGTVGWIIAGFVVSLWLKADSTETQFYVTAGAAAALGVYSFTLPHTPPPAAGKKASVREILGLDALSLMKQPSFAVFVIASFLICIPLAAYYAYAPVFTGKVGFDDPGFRMSFGQMSEIVFMLAMPLFFAFLGVKWMLLIGMSAWVLRYGLFAGADDGNIQWMVFAGILLHGICYDFFFVTGFIYTDKKCSKEIRGQAQGLLVLITQGLGLGIGAQVMAWLVGRYTPEAANELNAKSTELSKQAFSLSGSEMTERAAETQKSLLAEAQQLGDEAVRMMDWQTIWLIPCIAAAVIAFLFMLLFHDRVDADDKNSAEADTLAVNPGSETGEVAY